MVWEVKITDTTSYKYFLNVEYFHCGECSRTLDGTDLTRFFPKAKEIHFELEASKDYVILERVIDGVLERKRSELRSNGSQHLL